jgi:AcrR family transcriptional regulator
MTDTAVDVRTPASRRGAGRREAICEAVFELLAEVGYDRMTMDHVAERAHASKATIYRTWADKPEMVVDAIVQHFGEEPPPVDTGSLRGDLLDLMDRACTAANRADGDVITGLITAAGHTPALATAMQRTILESKAFLFQTIVARAVARGELPQGTDAATLQEVMHAMIVSRKTWQCGPMSDEFAVHVVDDVLLPVLKRPSS